jgi:DNA-binding GntR family transcriptional regulator
MTALRESGGLAAQRSELALKAREEQAQLLRQRILDYLNKEADLTGWRGLTEKAITDTLGGKRAYVIEALSKLTEEGSVCVQRQGTANNSPKLHWPRNRPPK